MSTYRIIRKTFGQPNQTLKTGLTLKQAQEHCNDPATRQEDSTGNVVWFDIFTADENFTFDEEET